MDHSDIEQGSLVDRYVQGTLPTTERGAFEEHFVDCQSCLEQLESARGLREALRLSIGQAPRSRTRPRPSSARWSRFAAAASVALALVPSAFLYRQLTQTRSQLDGSQQALSRRVSVESAAPSVYVLNQSRGGSGENIPVDIPPSGQFVVLLLQLDLSSFKTVNATLSDGDGKVAWQKTALRPTSADAIAVALPSTVLKPGEYTLNLEGINPDQLPRVVSSFLFQARTP